MPKPITRYLCNVCNEEYDSYEHALSCESTPVPENKYPDGSEITFERETSPGCYTCGIKGIVLTSQIYCQTGRHVRGWIVSVDGKYEAAVIELAGDLGSPCGATYSNGYADHLKYDR